LSQHEAIKRFLQHKDFQAHLIGQFIHRKLYENNPIPSMVCYEDFAVFPGMLMQSSKIVFSVRDTIITSNVTTVCRAVSTPVKSLRWLNAHYRWKKHSLVLFRHLVNCHWFDIYSNHRQHLTDLQLKLVKQRVNALYSLSFFFSRDVRFSYKKGLLRHYGKSKTAALSADADFEPYFACAGAAEFR
jgi:hypothetical protein